MPHNLTPLAGRLVLAGSLFTVAGQMHTTRKQTLLPHRRRLGRGRYWDVWWGVRIRDKAIIINYFSLS